MPANSYLLFERTPPLPLTTVYTAPRRQDYPFSAMNARCARCNRDLPEHWWQIIDPSVFDQAGVVDCGLIEVTA